MEDMIRIKGLNENNLKNVSLDIPKHKLIVFTGVSGSGKSSVVFDTIASESQRQMNETYSAFVRSRLPKYKKADVESIENLSASVVVDQSRLGGNARSTVGTITDTYAMLRLLFSRIGTPYVGTASHFSFNDPSGMCLKCSGVGKIQKTNIFKRIDINKSWNEGMCDFSSLRVDNWYWKKYRDSKLFPVDKKFIDFSETEKNHLLYGADTKSGKQINPDIEGIANFVDRMLFRRNAGESKTHELGELNDLITQEVCPMCHGKRLNIEALRCKINGYNINDLCEMEISSLKKVLLTINDNRVKGVVDSLVLSLTRMIDIGLPYLSLNRESSTLSGGEAQRLKLVRYMGSSLTDMIYIFDEPSCGMHPRDVYRMCKLLKSLRDKGNTVIVVEHDPDIIKIADEIIDMGPKAGVNGGQIMYQGSYDNLLKAETLTGKYLNNQVSLKANIREPIEYLPIRKANIHNLKNVDVDIPLNILTVITGVAGSGKSSLIRDCFYHRYEDRVVLVDQAPIATRDTSSPVTYLGIFDEIRKLFSKENNVDIAYFSYNSKGACPICNGKGYIVTELVFMDPIVSECEVCEGKRYNKEALSYLYKDKNIVDVLKMSVVEALDFFKDNKKIIKILNNMNEVGLGYLSLGQPLSSLSGGERQRIKLAKYLDKSGNIYVLDEPTTGLHISDIEKLMKLFNDLVDKGNTVIIIEHNLDVIKQADYIIDIGPDGGRFGGEVVFKGTVKKMLETSDSITAECLKANINNHVLSDEELMKLVKTKQEDIKQVKEIEVEDEEEMKINPIGIADIRNNEYKVIIDEKYKEALKGLDGFSHLQLVWWFDGTDNNEDRNLLVEEKPYTKGPDEIGIFATRSPYRPNPIAISTCGIKKIDYERGIIEFDYLDCFNCTQIIDIKPYTPSADKVNNPSVPDWCKHWPKSYEESGDFDWGKEFNF